MKLNPAVIQDLFHYSLALKGEENGMDSNSLFSRIQSGEAAKRILSSLELDNEVHFFEMVVLTPEYWNKESDMILAGESLWNKVVEWAQFHGINPRNGETTAIHCTVCGKPAMTRATQCFKHAFGHEVGEQFKSEWILTDGSEQTDRRMLTDSEADELNRQAKDATGGNWWWARNVNPSGRAGNSQWAS